MNNYERIRLALDLLREELAPLVSDRLRRALGDDAARAAYAFPEGRSDSKNIDVQVLANTIINNWDDVFASSLSSDARHFVHQVRKTRNRFAHQEKFDASDTYTALHEIQRLLEAFGSSVSGEIETSKAALLKDMVVGGSPLQDVMLLESNADAIATPVALLRLVVAGRVTETRFPLRVPVTIGRAPSIEEGESLDLSQIEGAGYVSRTHARITFESGVYWLTDLGSSNGTYLLGSEYDRIERAQIKNGDRVAFGNVCFLFEVVGSD